MITYNECYWLFTDCECFFPDHLRGPWYQKDFGDVMIGPSSITNKGHCVEAKGDFYLMHIR